MRDPIEASNDLIEELLEKLEKAESELRSHKAALGGLQAERDALQAKLDRLWEAFTAITEQSSVYEPADLEDSLGRIFTGEDPQG